MIVVVKRYEITEITLVARYQYNGRIAIKGTISVCSTDQGVSKNIPLFPKQMGITDQRCITNNGEVTVPHQKDLMSAVLDMFKRIEQVRHISRGEIA